MTLLEEQLYIATILEMYRPESLTITQKALIEAVNNISYKIEQTQGKWTRRRLREVQRAILEELNVPFNDIQKLLADDMAFVANMSIGTFFVSKEAVEAASKLSLTTQGYSIYELLSKGQSDLTKKLQTQLAASVASGESINDITRALKQSVVSMSKGQLKTVVRTTLAEVNNEVSYAAYNRLESRGLIEGYEYVATLDGRTSEGCRVRDGRRWRKPIDEIPSEDKPPRHFNCRSKLIPTTDFDIGDSGYRSSIGGPVPKGITYGEWFNGLSDTQKRKILGTKYYDKYKQGDFNVKKLSDVVSVRNLSRKGVQSSINPFLD